MGQWLGATVTCVPHPGGEIAIRWSEDDHVGGEVVLVDPLRHLILRWWDTTSLTGNDDEGMVTVLLWRLMPIHDGRTRLELIDAGYDRSQVSSTWMQEIERGWEEFLAALQELTRKP